MKKLFAVVCAVAFMAVAYSPASACPGMDDDKPKVTEKKKKDTKKKTTKKKTKEKKKKKVS